MKKKWMCVALMLSLLATVSCSEEGVEESISVTEESLSTKASERSDMPDIASCDYGGETFHVLAPEWGLYQTCFFTDEQNGEVMNDAIYDRKMLVEEYLGVVLTQQVEGTILELHNKVQSAVVSGDDTYQLVLTHCIQDLGSMVTVGLLYDFNKLPNISLRNDYWNQSCNENMALGEHLYYAISDYMLADVNAILFNKTLVEAYALDDPYELVRSGAWTLDTMFSLGGEVAGDSNGDGVFDLNDQYGFTTEQRWVMNSFLYSSGISLVEVNEKGQHTLAIHGEPIIRLCEVFHRELNGSSNSLYYPMGATAEESVKMPTGRVLFQVESLVNLPTLRDCTVEFGILPFPKLDETQESYTTNDWSGFMCIPKTVGNPDMIGKVCEMLAFYSAETTIPAYYDTLLGDKLARDEDSKEMLSLIYDGVVYDPGVAYYGFSGSMSNLFYTIPNMVINKGTDGWASWYATYRESAQAELDAFIQAVTRLEE